MCPIAGEPRHPLDVRTVAEVQSVILDTTDSAADDLDVPMYLANLTRQKQADEQHLSEDEPLHVDSTENPDGVCSYSLVFGP